MAVAYVSTRTVAEATTASLTSASWTIAGSDLAIVVHIMHQTGTVITGVTWSLGSGTGYEVATASTTGFDCETWVIPAPTAGSGTYTVTVNVGSGVVQASADLFTGAHQTDPCPPGDADTEIDESASTSETYTTTPTNVGANDAMAANHCHSTVGDTAGWSTGTLSSEDNTGSLNQMTGYRLATGSMTANAVTGSGAKVGLVGARVQAAGGTNITVTVPSAAAATVTGRVPLVSTMTRPFVSTLVA